MRFGNRAVAAVAAAAVLVSPALPGPLGEPARRLVNAEADGRDPLWDRPVDGGRLREIGDLVPDDATYAVEVRGYDPVLSGNLKAGAQLFVAPALPVRDPRRADWVVVHRAGRLELRGR